MTSFPILKVPAIKGWLIRYGHSHRYADLRLMLSTLLWNAESGAHPYAWPENPCAVESVFLLGDELNYVSTSDHGGVFESMADLLDHAEHAGRWAIREEMPTDLDLVAACSATAAVLEGRDQVLELIRQRLPADWGAQKFAVSDIRHFHRAAFLHDLQLLRRSAGDPTVRYDRALSRFLSAATQLASAWEYSAKAIKATNGELSWETPEEFLRAPKRQRERVLIEVAKRLHPSVGFATTLAVAARIAEGEAADHYERLYREWREQEDAAACLFETDTMDLETMATEGWEEEERRADAKRAPPDS